MSTIPGHCRRFLPAIHVQATIPDMFSVDFRPDPLIFDVWHNQRRYVNFIAQDVWTFVPMLYECVLGRKCEP